MPRAKKHICILFDCIKYGAETKCCHYCQYKDCCTNINGRCLNDPQKCGCYRDQPIKAEHFEKPVWENKLLNDYNDDYAWR